ncbi:MAG: hypothetical protein JWO32_1859 [Bacteroidetes bacterium]|nr:hypothetical protein [Bacteroidota bacterium]
MKKRSSYIIIGILLLLVGFSLYTYKKKNKSSTIDTEARDFKYKDTAAITKIFIADKEGDKSTLTRTKNGWVVNNKYPCRRDAILNLLEVIKNIEVKMPVSKKSKEGVLRVMAASALKVEIYAGDELVKQYYVGHETPDSEGSYVLLTDVVTGENYTEPFVAFIPGFQGFLVPRYIAKEGEWRDRIVLNYTPPQLKQIKFTNFERPDSSFIIDILTTNSFKLKSLQGKELPFDIGKMKQYLAYFQNVSYETLLSDKSKKLQDSLAMQKPFAQLTISSNDFRTSEFKFYYKQAPKDINAEHGVVYKYDPDRLYMRFDFDKEWALVQFYSFGKLFVSSNYFVPSSVKK